MICIRVLLVVYRFQKIFARFFVLSLQFVGIIAVLLLLLAVSVFRPGFNTWLALEPCWHVTSLNANDYVHSFCSKRWWRGCRYPIRRQTQRDPGNRLRSNIRCMHTLRLKQHKATRKCESICAETLRGTATWGTWFSWFVSFVFFCIWWCKSYQSVWFWAAPSVLDVVVLSGFLFYLSSSTLFVKTTNTLC